MPIRLLLFFLFLVPLFANSSAVSIPEIEQRVSAYPSNLKLKYVLSRAYAQKGQSDPRYFDKSIVQLEEILKTRQIPVVKFYLGLMNARKGDLDTAIYHWLTIARSLKPNNMTTLRYLALAFEKKKKHSESLEYWARILSLNPEDYKAHYHAALVTLRDLSIEPNIRFARAANHFQKVIRKFPDHKKSLWYLGLTYGNSRQYLKQRQVLQKLMVLMPSNPRILKEMQQNSQNLASQPEDAVLEFKPEDLQLTVKSTDKPSAVKPPVTPIRTVSVAMEISDDEFAAAFGRDPEPEEVPVEHRPEPVATNPTLPIDSPLSADAELLFNQGVTFMNNGEYDMALFHFLQAQELDPKFSQCYLQIGEVYFKLADATPTEEKFKEHLRLARQSLETAKQLEPDSLLAHAANSKMVQVEKKLQEGFEKAHLEVAKGALRSQNYRFAAEEFIILLTNGFSSTELMFTLADLIPNLESGSVLDIGNVLETFTTEKKLPGFYLLPKLLLKSDAERAWKLLDEVFSLPGRDVAFFDGLRQRADAGRSDFLDEYLLGRYLLESQAIGPAATWLEKSAARADKDSVRWIETWLSKAKSGTVRSSPSPLTPIQPVAGAANKAFALFEKHKQELLALSPAFSSVFQGQPELGDLQLKRDLLHPFLQQNAKNYLGQYLLGHILSLSALEQSRSQGEDLKALALQNEVVFSELDSDWYFMTGLLASKFQDSYFSLKYFEKALYGLLKRGFEVYSPYALLLAREADESIARNDLELAGRLIKQGLQFDALNPSLAAQRLRILERSAPNQSFSFARGYLIDLLNEDLYREVFKADIGNNLFWAIFLAILVFSAGAMIRHREELKHLIDELIGERSLSVPITTFVGLGLLIFFPTGLVVFLPLILWTFLGDLERLIYAVGITCLCALPLLFPVGYGNNVEHIRALLLMQNGEYEAAKEIYAERISLNPLDVDARFQMARIEQSIGKGNRVAISMLESIVSEYPEHFSAVGNLGVAYAVAGDTDKALKYLQEAFRLDPIDDRVIYNLARVYEIKGRQNLADNHLKWLGSAGEKSKANIDRYLNFQTQGLPLFAVMPLKQAIYRHNTWFGSVTDSSLSMSFLLFLGWFVMGGGLVGLLFFLKDKMDIVVTHCRFCDEKICNNCQSLLNGQPLCSNCFESEGRRRKGIHHFRQLAEYHRLRMARLLNFALPGVALTVQERPVLGFILGTVTFASFGWFLTGGGTIWNQVFAVNSTILDFLVWIGLGIAIVFYLMLQVLPGLKAETRTLL